MTLLDDALKAVQAGAGTLPQPASGLAAGHGSLDAGVDLAGAHVTYTQQVSKSWALSGWGQASWTGNRSAGLSLKGTW